MQIRSTKQPEKPPEWMVDAIAIPLGSLIVAVCVAFGLRWVRFWWTHGRHYSRMHRKYVMKQRRGN